ncbi:hypothetical protein ACEPAG_1569 [Sanghuangporus baumii]
MEMTYAALAKSLGISLKPISSTSTTPSSASSLPVPASAQTYPPETTNAFLDKGGVQDPPSFSTEESKPGPGEETLEERTAKDNSTLEQGAAATTGTKESDNPDNPDNTGTIEEVIESTPTKGPHPNTIVAEEDPGSDADAEGISDSDIASSRPSSPNLALAPRSFKEENVTETAVESQLTEPANVLLGTEDDPDKDADNESEPSAIRQPLTWEKMSDEQLHHAKVLVLDLLGWGVPPEYLLQRGVSHALLYTVFTDLRLRLPDSIFEDCVKLVST